MFILLFYIVCLVLYLYVYLYSTCLCLLHCVYSQFCLLFTLFAPKAQVDVSYFCTRIKNLLRIVIQLLLYGW
jgi:hypothetical protein